MLTIPHLTFYCELAPEPLQRLFSDPSVIEHLKRLKGAVSLGLMDLSQERAKVVRDLSAAGIPVIAWLLLPEDQGYWFNLDNAAAALERYREFRRWSEAENLLWDGIGLDIEPDIRMFSAWRQSRWGTILSALRKLNDRARLKRARENYRSLIAAARADGYRVDVYTFPLIAEERRAGSTLLQRFSGLVDLEADREVWMLYSSLFRPWGLGMLSSYAPDAHAVAVGVTGGGVDTGVVDSRPLTWEEFSRDLRLAHQSTDDIHIFSLEGCVEQGFLPRLVAFDWSQREEQPEIEARKVDIFRAGLRTLLFSSRYAWALLPGLVGAFLWVRLSERRLPSRAQAR